jgi:hypothetical protein
MFAGCRAAGSIDVREDAVPFLRVSVCNGRNISFAVCLVVRMQCQLKQSGSSSDALLDSGRDLPAVVLEM